jgi:hypothetical protein
VVEVWTPPIGLKRAAVNTINMFKERKENRSS